MANGWDADISRQVEFGLRRIAQGSELVDEKVVARLFALALIERTPRGFRLTPLGQRRYQRLPKAPLQKRRGPLAEYVHGLIEKAQAKSGAIRASTAQQSSTPPKAEPLHSPRRDEFKQALRLKVHEQRVNQTEEKLRDRELRILREQAEVAIARSRLLLSKGFYRPFH